MNHWFNLQPLETSENMKKYNKYTDKIKLNNITKILRFVDNLSKTNPYLCKYAKEAYTRVLETSQ